MTARFRGFEEGGPQIEGQSYSRKTQSQTKRCEAFLVGGIGNYPVYTLAHFRLCFNVCFLRLNATLEMPSMDECSFMHLTPAQLQALGRLPRPAPPSLHVKSCRRNKRRSLKNELSGEHPSASIRVGPPAMTTNGSGLKYPSWPGNSAHRTDIYFYAMPPKTSATPTCPAGLL